MTESIDQAIQIIKRFEGIRHRPYLCPAGKLTIGWGSTQGVKPGMEITNEQAEEMLRQEVLELESELNLCVTVKLKNHERAALLSLSHNIGITRFRASTLLKKLNSGDKKGASDEFLKWVHVQGKRLPGLVRRRAVEKDLFTTKITKYP
jgi:lysozyme